MNNKFLSIITATILITTNAFSAQLDPIEETRLLGIEGQMVINKSDIQTNKEDFNSYTSLNDSKVSSIESDISTLESDVWSLKQSSGGGNNVALQNQVNTNTFSIDDINKTTSGSDVDGVDMSKPLYGLYDVNYGTNDMTITLDKKGALDEIYGSYETNLNFDTGVKTQTLVENGLIQKVDYLMNNSGASTDLTQVNTDIADNKTSITNVGTKVNTNINDITALKNEDVLINNRINTNINNIADNKTSIINVDTKVNTYDVRITQNNNIGQSNKVRHDNNDIKNNEQDKEIKSLYETLANQEQKFDKKINQGISLAIAMNSPLDFSNGNRAYNLALGHYNGETSVSMGFGYKINDVVIAVHSAVDGSRNIGVKLSLSSSF